MPRKSPPAGGLAGSARLVTLAAGTRVWRVHYRDKHDAPAMNRTIPVPGRGGRFDSDDGTYAYLYVGDSQEAAIAESICRDLPLDGPRLVPRNRLTGRTLTELEVHADIPVAALFGPYLAAVGQDLWLTKCPSRDYPQTREWARAILADGVDGLAYQCRHDETRRAWMLATKPAVTVHPHLSVVPRSAIDLDSVDGRLTVSGVLHEHSATLAP